MENKYQNFTYAFKGKDVIITSYQGEDSKVLLPFVIEGKKVTEIGPNAFKDNQYVEEIIILKNITSIASHAFENCQNLRTIQGKTNITTIGDFAFHNSGLEEFKFSLTKLQYIGESAFEGCYDFNLEPIRASNKLTIGKRAFAQTGIWWLDLKAPTIIIGEFAFADCWELRDVKIHGHHNTINEGAFYNCKNLKNALIKSLVKLGDLAFKFTALNRFMTSIYSTTWFGVDCFPDEMEEIIYKYLDGNHGPNVLEKYKDKYQLNELDII